MIRVYACITFLLDPLIGCWLRYRRSLGKEDAARFAERFGVASRPRPDGLLVWIHAASVGEAMSVLCIMEQIHHTMPDAHIMLTTGTVTSAAMIAPRLPYRAFHQYVPVDSPIAVRRFLSHFKPDLAVWVESELWPNLVMQTHRMAIPMLLVNARLSARSAGRWRYIKRSFGTLLSCFTTIFAGSEADAQRLASFGHPDIRSQGNVKYDAAPLPVNSSLLAQLQSQIGDRPFWVAASTHDDEERRIADMHRQLMSLFPNLLTIIVPRHPVRRAAIEAMLEKQPVPFAVHSKHPLIAADTGIYLVDVMGELGTLFHLAPIVFVGGSLVPCGGHNPIEPAQHDCAVICGPHMENFAMVLQDLAVNDGLIQVADEAALLQQLQSLLQDSAQQKRHAETIASAIQSHKGVAAKIVQSIAMLRHKKVQS